MPNATLFGKGVSPFGVFQGLGLDCNYMSSIIATAVDPSRITSLFPIQSYNDQGVIAVNVFVRGKPTTIVVDDYLPYDKNGNLIFV